MAYFLCKCLRFSFALGGFCHFHPFNGFLCRFLVCSFVLGRSIRDKLLIKLQIPCFSQSRKAWLLWFQCAKGTKLSFFRPLPRFPAEFEHVTTYKQMAHGLFSLQFSRFSFCFGRLLPKCWKSCNFHAFPTAAKHHFYDFIAPKPSFFRPLPRFPAEFERVTTYKQMAHGLFPLAIFKVFLCFGRLLPNCWKSCSFHPFNGFLCISLPFSSFSCALGCSTPGQLLKKLQFPCFSHCRTASLLWFHCAKGTQPSFFRPSLRFPAEFEHATTYTKDGTWLIFSAIFSVFLFFGRLLPFPSFQWVSLPFSTLSLALGRSIRDKCWKSCNFHAFPAAGKPHFYDFIALRGPSPVSFVHR